MRLKLIACDILTRPFYRLAADSPQVVDIDLLERGLHRYPQKLREALRSRIGGIKASQYDAILLGYGLCGMAVAGLTAGEVPLVIPRAHDCITFFLGSRARYNQEFEACPGTYWYTLDALERGDSSDGLLSIGSSADNDLEAIYQGYVQKYGKDNADYLMEAMGAWQTHYQRAAAIDLRSGDFSQVEERARADANQRGWRYEKMEGDLGILKKLVWGDWDSDFLVIHPGETVCMEPGEGIITTA